MSLLAFRLPEIIGLTILHSLWQITLLWIILVTALRFCPKASSVVRYTLTISTLMLSVLTTAATAIYEWQSHTTGAEVSALSNGTAQTMHTIYITVKQTLLSRIEDALNASVPILAWIWCTGLVVMGARFGGSFFYLRKLRARENIAATSPFWEQEVKRLTNALGLRCEVAIATSTRISSPLTLGSISPIILLPAGLLSGMSTAQIEAILVHELYHIKRFDYIINVCQSLVEVLLFYHPAIWHLNNIIREERENCCDDQTVKFCGDAITYARALTQIQEINTLTKPNLAISASGPNAGNFSNRIKRLFHIYPNPARARSKGIVAIGFLIAYLGIVLVGANVSAARPVEPKEKSMKKNINEYKTLSSIFSDTIPASNHLDDPTLKESTPQQSLSIAPEEIRSMDMQGADTAVSERSLDKCLKQVSMMLKVVSINRLPGDSLNFSAWDSVHFVGSRDYFVRLTFKRQPTRFYGTINPSRIVKPDLIDTGNGTTTNIMVEEIHRGSVDSITMNISQQAIDRYADEGKAVQVFPNSANGHLNIRFTPARDNSRVKMVLVNSHGKLVKEITDSTYDNIPTTLHVDVSSYKKGIYVLQINIDGAKSQQRVIVE